MRGTPKLSLDQSDGSFLGIHCRIEFTEVTAFMNAG